MLVEKTGNSVEDQKKILKTRKQHMDDYWKHRNKRLKTHKKYRDYLRKNEPWIRKFWTIKQRCDCKTCRSYKHYGGKGIKMILTKEDLKTIWFRDNAFSMKNPSIDRIDNSGNYIIENCRFIELIDNIRRERKPKAITICIICQKKSKDYPSRNRIVCSRTCHAKRMSQFMIGNKFASKK